jgi:hypothetical protein
MGGVPHLESISTAVARSAEPSAMVSPASTINAERCSINRCPA